MKDTSINLCWNGSDSTPVLQLLNSYSVTAGDGGSVSTIGGTFSQGTQVSITATQCRIYIYIGWSNGLTENPITFSLHSELDFLSWRILINIFINYWIY